MSYLICLLTIAVAHFGGLDIIFLTPIPIDLWSILVSQISKKADEIIQQDSSLKVINIKKKKKKIVPSSLTTRQESTLKKLEISLLRTG